MATGNSFFDNIATNVKKEQKANKKAESKDILLTKPKEQAEPKPNLDDVLSGKLKSTSESPAPRTDATPRVSVKKDTSSDVLSKRLSKEKDLSKDATARVTTEKKPKKPRKDATSRVSKDISDISLETLKAFCIQGAKDIVAEDVSDHADLREKIKAHEDINSMISTKPTKTFEEGGVYKIYKSYSKKISEMPSYAYLAVCRAEKEKQVIVDLVVDEAKILELAKSYFVPRVHGTSVQYLNEAIEDGLKRLLLPSIEREVRSDKKQWADEAAIRVFGDNLKHLMLTPPIKGLTALGFDPGFRTGCKIAVVDKTGKFLCNDVVYPTEPKKDIAGSEKKLLELIKKHNIDLIVIGNGTASRESEVFINDMIKKNKLDTKYMIVSEAGASVYSASELAQEEYPTLDVTVRGAISIAHRVQDPLAELTKIDPKAIGVGQYQHDVDQKLLKQKLDEKVEDVVNSVGVDVNTASYTLLQYIAGLSPAMAKNLVEFRDEGGEFEDKAKIKKVKGLGPKAYEQAIGFLRIKGGKNPLDATGIHPEIHKNVYEFIENELSIKKKDLKLPMKVEAYTTAQIQSWSEKYEIGFETMKDVIAELQRPGLDPRDGITPPSFKSEIMEVKDLKKDMILDGTIRNVTDFGAFVDIGLHNDGLVHRSQLAPFFVQNPVDVVSVGQQVKVKVLEIDLEREKVSLSMKECDNSELWDKLGISEQKTKYQSQSPRPTPKQDFPSSSYSKDAKDDEVETSSGLRSNITFS